MKNCKIGGCADRSPSVCPMCRHWTPSRTHKYYRCIRYQQYRIVCDLPEGSCPTCQYYDDPAHRAGGMGRPNFTGVDWSDPDDVAEYKRERRRERKRQRMADDRRVAEEQMREEDELGQE